ncbi:hypothetical protein AZE42_12872 [Rhizopogon vesiculosus]|uniref:Uncharacterized protein n=1 Tax=Rhizopogon vesiculosus TaxID=180088 RepID=A0A1J8QYT6_9AGAM|nr:hypothetical protein AZE42_12872 [Rhizopogon vesiculosus]
MMVYYGDVDIDSERIRQLPEDDVPDELLEGVRQSTDSGVVDQESEGYLPEEDDSEDQSTLNELPEVIPLQALGSTDTDLTNISGNELMAWGLNHLWANEPPQAARMLYIKICSNVPLPVFFFMDAEEWKDDRKSSLYSELSAGPNYIGSANGLNNVIWQRDTSGHIAVEKSLKKEFVAVIVGRVGPQKLNCGPEGNHIRAYISPLHKAKFQFQLGQPFGSVFAEDFDKAIQNLEGLQAKITETTDRRNMIVSDKSIKLIRFTSNIFEERKELIPKHAVYLSDVENLEGGQKSKVKPLAVSYTNAHRCIGNPPVMDAETDNWPIPLKYRDEFDSMKFNFEASPLRVYRGNSLVEPVDVNDALTGAVVEVYFVIRHYYLRDKKFDSFGADIQQVKILKPGTSIARSGFKRRSVREGPFEILGTASISAHAKGDELGRAEKRSKQGETKGTSSGP